MGLINNTFNVIIIYIHVLLPLLCIAKTIATVTIIVVVHCIGLIQNFITMNVAHAD